MTFHDKLGKKYLSDVMQFAAWHVEIEEKKLFYFYISMSIFFPPNPVHAATEFDLCNKTFKVFQNSIVVELLIFHPWTKLDSSSFNCQAMRAVKY
jgi:hypothetical protein